MKTENQDTINENYKFKDLKIYSSTEWFMDNKKRYRQVFDRHEVSYIYAELAIYNKRFDQEVWEANVTLKCYRVQDRSLEMCNLTTKSKISKYDNIVYIREGWGNKKKGVYWKQGTYFWEAYIGNEKVASKYFYVEDVGKGFKNGINPYLAVKSVKLFEGKLDSNTEENPTYLTVFSERETRYIYAEIEFYNHVDDKDWHCEVFVNFFNQVHEHKGQIIRLKKIDKKSQTFKIVAGWGSNSKGTWKYGDYFVEIVFMGKLLATAEFSIDDFFDEGVPKVELPNSQYLLPDQNENIENRTFAEVLQELDDMIGLSKIKKKVKEHAQYIQFLKLRKDKGFEEKDKINIHSVFVGNPGTGKTTVAKKMGLLYNKMGLLSKGHVLEVDRVDLVGEYIGQTAPKVKEVIERARGGVLFIDEAYSLARANDDTKDFGREVIEILVKEMSNGKGDIAIIVAGYPKEMKYFLDSNPGLRSRFKQYYEFPDYLPQELIDISTYACREKEVVLADSAAIALNELITEAYRNRDRHFGNARFVFDLIEKAKVNMALRIMERKDIPSLSTDEIKIIKLVDVENIDVDKKRMLPDLPVDEKLLDLAMQELDSLIGIHNIKEQIKELVDIVRYYKESEKSVLSSFFLHTVFVGNPGTGKTTVARILTKIYKALGILERGHMIETDRQGLVAGFIGQTAIKTNERIEEALGGVLFIDEAYSLSGFNGLQGDYGNESIQTLLKRMEDHRGEFFVFVAGYPQNMENFLKANPGLSSRFDKTLKFEDYTPDQLTDIAKKMFDDEGVSPSKKAISFLRDYFANLYLYRDKYFGNARSVRKIVLEVIKNHNLRLAALSYEERKTKANTITYQDVASVEKLQEEEMINPKKGIGYRSRNH